MRLQIDFKNKTIKVEGNVKLKEFINKIQTILEDWEEYELQSNTVIVDRSNSLLDKIKNKEDVWPYKNIPKVTYQLDKTI